MTPTNPSYYGMYRCSASNSMGEATLDIALRQATAPGLVSGVTVKVSSLGCPLTPSPLTSHLSPLTSHPPPVGVG